MPPSKKDPRAAIYDATDDAEIVETLKRLMKQKKTVWVNCQHCGGKTSHRVEDTPTQMAALKTWMSEGFGKPKDTVETQAAGGEIRALLEFPSDVRARALVKLREALIEEQKKSPPKEALLPDVSDESLGDDPGESEVEEIEAAG
jgi:hypothetical protein